MVNSNTVLDVTKAMMIVHCSYTHCALSVLNLYSQCTVSVQTVYRQPVFDSN